MTAEDAAATNPLHHATSAVWDRLIAGTNPSAMLVAISGMLGATLRRQLEVEDVWQETLLQAWSSRADFLWQGEPAFRRWLLGIARNRVRDLADRAGATKRGAGRELRAADRDAVTGTHDAEHYAGPCGRTTPGCAAADRETAALFERALADVAEDQREVVRLRLFEDSTFDEIAACLGIGVEGVRYRFRLGAEAYRRALRRHRAIAPTTTGTDRP